MKNNINFISFSCCWLYLSLCTYQQFFIFFYFYRQHALLQGNYYSSVEAKFVIIFFKL